MREVFRMGAVLTRPSRRVHYRVLYSAAWAFGERNKEEKKKRKKMVQLTMDFPLV